MCIYDSDPHSIPVGGGNTLKNRFFQQPQRKLKKKKLPLTLWRHHLPLPSWIVSVVVFHVSPQINSSIK